jgi:hypothetical protein
MKIEKLIKYLVMGLIVLIATRYIPDKVLLPKELIMIGCTSAITFAIIDMVSPTVVINTDTNINKNNNYN